jgi:predicted SAM-dependent methyltransferase
MCHDDVGNSTVDMVADFNEPLPLESESWDGIFSQYAFEHISWRKARQFVSEIYRVLKPDGKCILVVPNTEEQLKWIQNNQQGWDNSPLFESASCKLFGDLDYPENSHKMYLSPSIIHDLFKEFGDVKITPSGARGTDMIVEVVKTKVEPVETFKDVPEGIMTMIPITTEQIEQITDQPVVNTELLTPTPEQRFNREYFNGGVYKPFYWDYPINEAITQNIVHWHPKSVLELGCGRGYVLKRIQDKGIRGCGLDVSKHCWLTRACEGIIQHDVCKTPWPFKDKEFDLCYSYDFLQWLPSDKIDTVLSEMVRVSARSVHGVLAGTVDAWYDQIARFFDIGVSNTFSLEEMQQGQFPQEVLKGDGKVKLNLGCFMTMFHHGWVNLDVHNLTEFANQNQYRFIHHDLRNGLPQFGTESIDLILLCHVLEHFNYHDGLGLLKECRRVLKPSGTIRVIVPDTYLLVRSFARDNCWDVFNSDDNTVPMSMSGFDELSDGCANASTIASKLHALLYEGHQAIYDEETLGEAMQSAGFNVEKKAFRQGNQQILKETLDMVPCLSLYMEGTPKTT